VSILALASLITTLVINSQSVNYLQNTLTNNMNNYNNDQDTMNIVDNIQSAYQCCGVYLWLDWGRVQLSFPGGIGK